MARPTGPTKPSVIDERRAFVADKAAKNRWNRSRTRFAEMQNQLYDLGAFGEGADRDYEVDGLSGTRTTAALKRAEELGYTYDSKSNKLIKRVQEATPVQPATEQLTPRSRTIAQEQMHQGVETMKSSPVFSKEYFSGMKDAIFGAASSSLGNIRSRGMIRSYDNMYPYSYGDVLVNQKTGEVIPYSGGEVPQGFRLTQAWASTSNDPDVKQQQQAVEGKAALFKTINSVKGKDPRKEYMEQMAAVDLSTPEGQKQWKDMVAGAPQGMVRINGNPINDQWEMRARLDQMNMYAGRPQQWNTYEVNPNYSSPTATARGSSTYRIADPAQRERIHGEMVNYFLAHKGEGKWLNDEKTAYVLPNMGYMGNQSLVADDENGTNLRYGDWWDYTINAPNAHRFYTGDLLTEPGKTPVRTKYGVGHNSAAKTEGGEEIKEALVQGVKDDVRNRVQDFTSGFQEAWQNLQNGITGGNRLIARNN